VPLVLANLVKSQDRSFESVTETCPGLRGYYKNVKRVSNDCIEIHFIKEIPKGYFWIFPSTDGLANVGIGADKETLIKQKINSETKGRFIFIKINF
jgi:flavin-dependent dehydrogenase